jgi:hypothetical protein
MNEEELIGKKVVALELGNGEYTTAPTRHSTFIEFEDGTRLLAFSCGCCDGIGWDIEKSPIGEPNTEQSV